MQVLQEFAAVARSRLNQREDVVLRQLDLLKSLEIIEPDLSFVCRSVLCRDYSTQSVLI